MTKIIPDAAVQQELALRGIDASTGVYGDHKVQIGTGPAIRLDEIATVNLPYPGFKTAVKTGGKAGLRVSADAALATLHSRTGTLDAKGLLGALKVMQTQTAKLDAQGKLTQAQKEDSSWTFTAAVQSLSNRELSAVYQTFTSAEMDLLQTALMHEGQTNRAASDARKAAAQLFDLQALVLKEISNRYSNEQIDQTAGDLVIEGMPENDVEVIDRPKTLTEQFGSSGKVAKHVEAHDITAANLLSLTEVGARSATVREKTAQAEQAKLNSRGLDDVTVKEIGDTLRKAELTINIPTEHLIGGPNSIFDHPDDPMVNIHHLHDQDIHPKGKGYLDERASTEEVLFPEMKGHDINADERPLYGALNIQGRSGGAISENAGYGRSAVVLKPEVAKRATFIANDTFFAVKIKISEERRQNFYRLLDGSKLPKSLRTALKDPNSKERKDFDAWLDEVAEDPDATVLSFKPGAPPESVRLHLSDEDPIKEESIYSTFKGFLTDCFGDAEATRGIMATHDNLEALITQMDSVAGNSLARAVKENKQGNISRIVLSNVQYIEAQIQGPLIPSRDIAEIRIDMVDVPQKNRADLRIQAMQYERETGIKVTLIEDPDSQEKDDNAVDRATLRQDAFNAQHMDQAALEAGKNEYLEHLDEKVLAYAQASGLSNGLPQGELRLEGNALAAFGQKFLDAVDKELANPNPHTVEDLLTVAFENAVRPMLTHKAALLRELNNSNLNPAQRAAVAKWVVSAKDLRTVEELRAILKHAGIQAALLKEITEAEPPMPPEQIFRRMNALAADMDRDLVEVINAFDDPDFGAENKNVEQDRVSFMSLALLQNADPPMDGAAMRKLYDRLNSPACRTMMEQVKGLLQDRGLQDCEDHPRISIIYNQLYLTAGHVGKAAGQFFKDIKGFEGELSLLQEPLRTALREAAPQVGQKLDELHPGYAPMPVPANPQAMPQNDGERRAFCLQLLSTYLNNEQTFEEGTAVHGRGHIVRAFIFATVMCNILQEYGIKVDKNAVLCGIAGHDMGREGTGGDRWEERSGNMTAEAMSNAFGPNTMGQEYAQEIKDCIYAHKSKTLEGMLLNAADSLDIGRTKDFKPENFLFLKGREGEIPGSEAKKIREQLQKEADLLQRLTNPLCANRQTIMQLQELAAEADAQGNSSLGDFYFEKKQELIDAVADQFRDDWTISNEDYMTRFENVVRNNPQMFPLLSKYYH